MKPWFKPIDDALSWTGKQIAAMWLVALALVTLFGFFVSGFAASLWVGFEVARWIDLGAWAILPVALFFGLFLSIYVWTPYVRPVVLRVVDLINESNPGRDA